MEQNLIIAKNIKTGEVVEFATQKEATDYFKGIYGDKITNSNVVAMLKQKKAYKGIWQVNYIGDGKLTKICEHCGKKFKTGRNQKVFCSATCREEYITEQKLSKKTIQNKTPKEKELIHKLYVMLTPLRTTK